MLADEGGDDGVEEADLAGLQDEVSRQPSRVEACGAVLPQPRPAQMTRACTHTHTRTQTHHTQASVEYEPAQIKEDSRIFDQGEWRTPPL